MAAQAATPDQTITILRQILKEPRTPMTTDSARNGMRAADLGADSWAKP